MKYDPNLTSQLPNRSKWISSRELRMVNWSQYIQMRKKLEDFFVPYNKFGKR